MSKKVNWIIADQNITVNYDGQTHILSREDPNAAKLIAALKERRYDDVPKLVSAAKRIEHMSNGKFTVKDGQIWVDGVVVPTVLGRKIEEFANEGLPYEPLVLFAKNLQTNPSFRATQHLYEFLEKNNHPITENGCFIAYKRVRPNFLDIHSGTMDNSPGKVVEMPRNQVNEDPNQTCSYGLHVANWDYAHNHFGGSGDVMLEVEVHPADVVAIPVDYNQSKMRVCKYKVIGTVEVELSTPLRLVNPVPAPAPYVYYGEEAEEVECDNCGSVLDNPDDYLCEDCDEEDEEESSSSEDEDEDEDEDEGEESFDEEETDEYPWEDEVK